MRLACFDCGSNTILCTVTDVQGGKIAKVLYDEVEVVRLSEGLEKTGRLSEAALQRAQRTLSRFISEIKYLQPEKMIAVCTSACRDAENSKSFLNQLADLGIEAEVISGEKEARLSHLGAVEGQQVLLIDTGGGSTEFSEYSEGIFRLQSLDIGSVRLTERWVSSHPLTKDERDKLVTGIDHELSRLKGFQATKAVAVAGTPVSLVSHILQLKEFNRQKIESYYLSVEVLQSLFEKLCSMSIEQRELTGIAKGRADVIPVGCCILWRSCVRLGLAGLSVSTRGLRFGMAKDHTLGEN